MLLPNQLLKKLATVSAGAADSTKMTDSSGAIVVTPFKATALANAPELSSTFQPVMSSAVAPLLVTSNQSAPTGLLPLDHGATSEMVTEAAVGVSLAMSLTDRV